MEEMQIFRMDYTRNPEGELIMTYIPADEPVPEGWTRDRSSLVPDPKTEQDQINKNLTMQLAKANIEIAKLKSQIGGTK